MKFSLLFVLGGLAAVAAAPAPPRATLPVAGAQLTEDQLWTAWPAAARSVGLEATVAVVCVITLTGTAENCSATTSMKQSGFEAASIALVRTLKFTPATVDGRPTPAAAPITLQFLCGNRCRPFAREASKSRALVLFPVWSKTPTAAEIAAVYPQGAAEAGVDGSATLLCRRLSGGTLDRCAVAEEAPLAQGFGAAALRLSGDFSGPKAQAAPKDDTFVRVVVRFRRAEGQSSAATLAEGERMPPPSPADPPAVRAAPIAVGTHFYPERAARRGLNGSAMLICRVQQDESVKSCAVAQETPPGVGFGEAGVKMSVLFRVAPRIVEDREFRDDYKVIPATFNLR